MAEVFQWMRQSKEHYLYRVAMEPQAERRQDFRMKIHPLQEVVEEFEEEFKLVSKEWITVMRQLGIAETKRTVDDGDDSQPNRRCGAIITEENRLGERGEPRGGIPTGPTVRE